MPRPSDLHRSTEHKLIAGVCAGIAEWLGWSRLLVRILFVMGSILPIVPGFVVYAILWIALPAKDRN